MRSIPWKQWTMTLGLAGAIAWRVPFAGVRAAFYRLEIGPLLLAFICLLGLLLLRSYKWHQLLAAGGRGCLRQSLRSLFGGYALGLITPGRLGELGRCAFVRKEERAQVALLTVYDRLLDFWALLTALGASLFFLAPRPAAVFGVAVWVALLPVVTGFPTLVSQLTALAGKSRHFRAHFTETAVGMPRVRTPLFAVMAMGAMVMELASFFFLLRAFFPTRFSAALATYPLIVLAGDLPISFSGVGVREGAAALLLASYSVPASAAVGASLLWLVFGMLLPATVGASWLIVERTLSRVLHLDKTKTNDDATWMRADIEQTSSPLITERVAPSCEAG